MPSLPFSLPGGNNCHELKHQFIHSLRITAIFCNLIQQYQPTHHSAIPSQIPFPCQQHLNLVALSYLNLLISTESSLPHKTQHQNLSHSRDGCSQPQFFLASTTQPIYPSAISVPPTTTKVLRRSSAWPQPMHLQFPVLISQIQSPWPPSIATQFVV